MELISQLGRGLKMNVLSKTAIAGAFLLVCGAAQAANVNWGVLSAGDFRAATNNPPQGLFEDTYSFGLLGTQLDQNSAVALDLTTIFNISGGSYALFNMGGNGVIGGGDDVMVGGAWPINGTTGSTFHQVALGAGQYYFDVTGIAGGAAGGLYSIATTVLAAPVPEPEIYAMMAAGLGLMGFVARRRQQRKEQSVMVG